MPSYSQFEVILHFQGTAASHYEPGITNIDFLHTVVQGNDLTLAGNCHHALRCGRTERELGFLPGVFRRISEMNSDSYLLLYII